MNQVYTDLYYALTGESQLYGFPTLIPENVVRGKNYCIYPVHAKAGHIQSINGIEEMKQWNNVVVIPQQKNVGDDIADSGSFGQVVALVHFTFDHLSDCKETIDRIHQAFIVHNPGCMRSRCGKHRREPPGTYQSRDTSSGC